MRWVPSVALAMAAIAAPTLAQDTDQQFAAAFSAPMPSSGDDAKFAHAFGLCAARDVQSYSRSAMRAMPASDASDKALFWMVLGSNSCAEDGKPYNFSPRALRGVVAEFYLKRDFDLVAWKAKRDPIKTFSMPTDIDAEKLPANTRSTLAMLAIAACVSEAEPAGIATLFGTKVGSPDEGAALAMLSPSLSKCVPPGMQLKLTKFELRGILAEAAYRTAAEVPEGRN